VSVTDPVTGLGAPTRARLHAAVEAAHLLAVVRAWAGDSADTVLWARAELAGLAVERVLRQLASDEPRATVAPLREVRAVLRRLDDVAVCGAGDELVAHVEAACAAVQQLAEHMAGR
jgi:hypothetical protein